MARDYDLPRRPTPKWLRRTRFTVLGIVLFLVLFGLQIVKLITDAQWFREVRQTEVFYTALSAKLTLFFGFGLLFFLVVYFNLWLARRMNSDRPKIRMMHPEREEFMEQMRRGAHGVFLLGAIVLSFMIAGNAASHWSEYLLFTHAGSFGQTDPIFHNDIGFYVFRLPFLSYLQGWLLFAIILTALGVALFHFSQGGIDFNRQVPTIEPYVWKHVMSLAGVALIVWAAGVWLGRYDLLFSDNGVFFGAGYTDLHARLPGMVLQTVCLAIAGILCFIGMRSPQTFKLPLYGIAGWAASALLVGGLYAVIIQNYSVTPNQQGKEREYIAHDIAFTQRAYGLNNVQVQDFPNGGTLTGAQLTANSAALDNIRLWDWPELGGVYTARQAFRNYYRFQAPETAPTTNAGDFNIDVDRYHLGADYRQVMLAARELYPDGLPSGAKTWQNQKLQYTHGYGAVMSPVNLSDLEGLPQYFMSGIPIQTTQPALNLTQPQIYYGELTKDYVFVDSRVKEFDYPTENGSASTEYAGKGGILLGGAFNRFLWSLRLGDTNMLLSSDLTDRTRILFRRNIRERVQALAPFLNWDNDPYIVVDGGRILWMIDGYTTTDRYPYSKPTRVGTASEEVDQTFNYIRNSVKAVVDSYDGSVTLYVSDPKDPLVNTWSRIFPGLLTSMDRMPASLRAHVRYPEDLFRIQRDIFKLYHIGSPDAYYLKEDMWDVPQEPEQSGDSDQSNGQRNLMAPYYVLLRLPGSNRNEFMMMSPFTPLQQGNRGQNLAAWMAAACDPDDYGKLVVYRFPKGTNVNGPQQVLALIRKQPDISQYETLMGQHGSKLIYGNLLIIPIENSLLYVVPLYVQSTGSGAVPGLSQVILATADQIVMKPSLNEAIAALGGGQGNAVAAASPTTPGQTPNAAAPPSAAQPGSAAAPGSLADRIRRANNAYSRARKQQQDYDRALDDLGKALKDLESVTRR